jgi:hypothetical protein
MAPVFTGSYKNGTSVNQLAITQMALVLTGSYKNGTGVN